MAVLIKKYKEDRLGFIVLNRPEKRNALNSQMVTALKDAFNAYEADPEVKVVILKGEGQAFSAGADLAYLQQLQSNSFEENYADSSHLKELFELIYNYPKVVVAQVEGHAIAGGCGLATVCDFVYAVPEAMFGYTEVKIGFVPAIVMVFLLRKIGEAKAKDLLFTGRLFGAAEAKSLGLINVVSEADQINKDVLAFCKALCSGASGQSLALTKQMIAQIPEMTLEGALDYAARSNAKARDTEDCRKGIAAFLNKEKLNW